MKLKDKFEERVYTIDATLCVENIIEKIAFTLEQGL
jgi:thymidylate kinase